MPSKKWAPPKRAVVSVYVERAGAGVRLDNVPASEAFKVLRWLLEGMRATNEDHPEITPVLPPVEGGHPIGVGFW